MDLLVAIAASALFILLVAVAITFSVALFSAALFVAAGTIVTIMIREKLRRWRGQTLNTMAGTEMPSVQVIEGDYKIITQPNQTTKGTLP